MPERFHELVLASASPRRKQLLAQIGLECEVTPSSVDETPHDGEPPAAYVRRLAREKAIAVARDRSDRFVIGADTAVVVDGVIMGKPADRHDAERMLRLLSARGHEVMSAVAVAHGGTCDDRLTVTKVSMGAIDARQLSHYLRSEEWQDKAGAYAIQGRAAAFVTAVAGTYSGVVGLPLHETMTLLIEAGFDPMVRA